MIKNKFQNLVICLAYFSIQIETRSLIEENLKNLVLPTIPIAPPVTAQPYDFSSQILENKKRLKYLDQQCKLLKKSDHAYFNVDLDHLHMVDNSRRAYGNIRFHKFFYSFKAKYIFCTPPKTGTSNWQKALIRFRYNMDFEEFMAKHSKLNSIYQILPRVNYLPQNNNATEYFQYARGFARKYKVRSLNAEGLEQLREKLSPEELSILTPLRQAGQKFYSDFIQQSQYKVMTVRHPVERLFSAWRQKFELKDSNRTLAAQKNIFVKNYGQYIDIKDDPPVESGKTWYCSFQDFILYFLKFTEQYERENKILQKSLVKTPQFADSITDQMQKNLGKIMAKLNAHWRLTSWQCLPCNVNYDFIAKSETLAEDSSYILNNIFGARRSKFPAEYFEILDRYSTHVGLESHLAYLEESVKQRLRKVLEWDLKLFGYTY